MWHYVAYKNIALFCISKSYVTKFFKVFHLPGATMRKTRKNKNDPDELDLRILSSLLDDPRILMRGLALAPAEKSSAVITES